MRRLLLLLIGSSLLVCACQQKRTDVKQAKSLTDSLQRDKQPVTSQPLVTHIFTADPSAHVFNGKIYIYPSHDIDAGIPENDNGDHFDMRDYHVLSLDSIGGHVVDNGVALDIKNIPWARRQLWAPDASYANGTYFLYFPAKDKQDIFRIGVATSASPIGPFKAESTPIAGSYSIDPAVFTDSDGNSYMYFGGIWGGQLQRWNEGNYNTNGSKTDLQSDDQPAIKPRVAKLAKNMLSFEGPVREVKLIDKEGNELLGKDHERRFFEASWVHKYKDNYYFSYSTGDTHFIVYAIGKSPYGPFTFQGTILKPVVGWTNHHSIVEVNSKSYLFYHDSILSGGKTHLRSVKVKELSYTPEGLIEPIEP